MVVRTREFEFIGSCGHAFEEVIKIRKNLNGSEQKNYPWEILGRTEYCNASGSKYRKGMMYHEKNKLLPCCGDPDSPECCVELK